MAMSRKTLFFITIICAISYRVLTEAQKEKEKIENEEVIRESTNGTTNTTCTAKIDKFEIVTIIGGYGSSLIFVLIINIFLWKQHAVPEKWQQNFMARLQGSCMAVNLIVQISAFVCEILDADIIQNPNFQPTIQFFSRVEFSASSLLISIIFYDTISEKTINEESGRIFKWIDLKVRLLLNEGFWWLFAPVILSTYPQYIGCVFILTNFYIMILGAFYENDCRTVKTFAMFLFRCRISIFAALKLWYDDELQNKCLKNLGFIASFLKEAEITRGIVVYFIWLQDTNAAQKEAVKTLTDYILARPNGVVNI